MNRQSSVACLELQPATPQVARALDAWRDKVGEIFDANNEFINGRRVRVDPKTFHITLAYPQKNSRNVSSLIAITYLVWPIAEADAAELEIITQRMENLCAAQFGEVELCPPLLTKFHDMSLFIPMLLPKDHNLFLGYDIHTGKASYINSFEYGTQVEQMHQLQWTMGWTHFVPFQYNGEGYCINLFKIFLHVLMPRDIAYKQHNGRLHLVNAKTAYSYVDAYTGDTEVYT